MLLYLNLQLVYVQLGLKFLFGVGFHLSWFLNTRNCSNFISHRILERKLFKHGIWMIVMQTRDCHIIKNQRSLYLWTSLLVSIFGACVYLTAVMEFCTPLNHVHVLELGVLSWRLDADNYETDPDLKKIREDRGYSYQVCHMFFYKLMLELWRQSLTNMMWLMDQKQSSFSMYDWPYPLCDTWKVP